ncbi:MAG: 50S ribosomal protein L30 [candidate division Zixibacteria bacterium RBG_16_40_9]|nr:MAG: 50S ribosomal protein L30 [candidate division Zixibacteria bacterium RBG_16_40_9]
MTKKLKIKQIKSAIGYSQREKNTIKALGIRKLQQEVIKPNNPQIQGMIGKVRHLLKVEEVKPEKAEKTEK